MGAKDRDISRFEGIKASPAVRAAVAASAVLASAMAPAKAQAAELVCGNDFDQDYGTRYGVGGVEDKLVTPSQMTGGLGFRSKLDQEPYVIEKTSDGVTFSDYTSVIDNAIREAGYRELDGRYLQVCDYSYSRDELMVRDGWPSNIYIVGGIARGPMDVKILKGQAVCGSIDESTGRYFASGGGGKINEYFHGEDPAPFYDNAGETVFDVYVDLADGQMSFTDYDNGNKIVRVTGLNQNYPHPNAVKEQVGNLTGSVLGLYGPAETGGGTVLLTNADGYLQYCVEEDERTDIIPPTVRSAKGENGDGYYPGVQELSEDADSPTEVDCNDTSFKYVLEYDEAVVVDFAECVSEHGSDNLTDEVTMTNGNTVATIPGHVSPEMTGPATLTVIAEDMSGNARTNMYYVDIECPTPENGVNLIPGEVYDLKGGQIVVDPGVKLKPEDEDNLELNEDSKIDAWAHLQDAFDLTVVVPTEEGDAGFTFDDCKDCQFGIVLGVAGGRSANDYGTCLAERCLAVKGDFTGRLLTIDNFSIAAEGDVFIPLDSVGSGTGTGTGDTTDTGTGSGTGTGGTDGIDNGHLGGDSGNGGKGCDNTAPAGAPLGGLAAVAGLTTLIGRRRREE